MDGQLVGVRGAGLYAALTQRAPAPRLVLLTVGRQAHTCIRQRQTLCPLGSPCCLMCLLKSVTSPLSVLTALPGHVATLHASLGIANPLLLLTP